MLGVKVSGKVKWFNNAKGYGFIITDAHEGLDQDGKHIDFFAHYSTIEMEGYKTLKAGQDVTFNIVQGPKGLQAQEIKASIPLPDPKAVIELKHTVSN